MQDSSQSLIKLVKHSVDYHSTFIGAPGKQFVSKNLLKGQESIKGLQESCGLSYNGIKPVIEFLSTFYQVNDKNFGINYQIYQNLIENMKNSLEDLLMKLPDEALLIMLSQTIRYIIIKDLKTIPISIIKRLKESIPVNVCKFLASDNICPVVSELPLSARRQIWSLSRKQFNQSLNEHFSTFLSNTHVYSAELRNVGSPAKIISEYIGDSEKLFEFFGDFCSHQSIGLNSVFSGSLITHVLMCLSESGKKMKSLGKLHDLALVIDQILRKGLDDSSFDSIIQNFKSLIHMHKATGKFLGSETLQTSKTLGPVNIKAFHHSKNSSKTSIASSKKRPSRSTSARHSSKSKRRRHSDGYSYDYDDSDGYSDNFEDDFYEEEEEQEEEEEDHDHKGDGERRNKRVSRSRQSQSSTRKASSAKSSDYIDILAILSKDVIIEAPVIDVDHVDEETCIDIYEDAVQFIKNMDLAGVFAAPVPDYVQGYHATIKTPMDLSTIQTKIARGDYLCFEALSDDILLMLDNCMVFNMEGSDYYDLAKFMSGKWQLKSTKVTSLLESIGNSLATYQTNRLEYLNRRKDIPKKEDDHSLDEKSPKPVVSLIMPTRNSTQINKKISQVVDEVISFVSNLDVHGFFLNPVTEEIAPDYFTIISQPMDLLTIKSKKAVYKTPNEICDDVDLIFSNSMKYNNPTDIVYKAARSIKEKWRYLRISILTEKSSSVAKSNHSGVLTLPTKILKPPTPFPKVAEDSKILKLIKEGFNYFLNIDERKIFALPVTDDIAPNYSKIILNPMDLNTISKRINQYRGLDDLKSDVELILKNCTTYNNISEFYLNYVRKINRLWTPKIQQLQEREQEILIDGDYNLNSDDDFDDKDFDSQNRVPKSKRIFFKSRRLVVSDSEESAEDNNFISNEFMDGGDDVEAEWESGDEELPPPPSRLPSFGFNAEYEIETNNFEREDEEDENKQDDDDDDHDHHQNSNSKTLPKLILSFNKSDSKKIIDNLGDLNDNIVAESKYEDTELLNESISSIPDDDSSFHGYQENTPKMSLKLNIKALKSSISSNQDLTMELPSDSLINNTNIILSIDKKQFQDMNDEMMDVEVRKDTNLQSSILDINQLPLKLKTENAEETSIQKKETQTESKIEYENNLKSDQSQYENLDLEPLPIAAPKNPNSMEAEGRLMWAVVMFRDSLVQNALRNYLVKKIDKLFSETDKLPVEDKNFLYCYQLYELSCPINLNINDDPDKSIKSIEILGEFDFIIRRVFPLIILEASSKFESQDFFSDKINRKKNAETLVNNVLKSFDSDQILPIDTNRKILLHSLVFSWFTFRASKLNN